MVKKTCGGGVPAAASNVASHPVHLRRWAGAAANSNTHGTYPAQPNMPRRSERQVGRPATSATGRSRRTDMCPIPRGCNSSRRVQSTTCRAKTVVKLQRHQRVRRDHASLARLCNGYGLTPIGWSRAADHSALGYRQPSRYAATCIHRCASECDPSDNR